MEDCVERELPRYRSHKIVHALKIKEVRPIPVDPEAEASEEGPCTAIIFPEDEGYRSFGVGNRYVEKHDPKAGGYYVVYEDGYKSFSPAEAFESGYTRL